MTVTIRLFASARDAFGFESRTCTIDEPTVDGVRRLLLQEHPEAGPILRTCRFAVNMAYTVDDAPLKEGDEVAVIPPVSGG